MTDIDSLLRSTGAVLEGHFRLASGRHSGIYIEKFRIMENPAATEALCSMIADHFRDSGATVVAGPAMGGVILAYETARHLGLRSIFAEKAEGDRLFFDRGFVLEPGQPVLVVDDVLTTGGSVKKMLALVEQAGAKVAGVGFLIDRTNGGVDFGVPFFACHTINVESYAPDECPLCPQGLPLTET
ncbi:MAG TPA: orotate phosphoribosyltransferase [Dehalococcoidia bacterium]|nr:orotate phosphoribosyltransferase [Dehalococcoidia bacterium]